eukprot:scaffold32047_cov35-Tisochrysis_lutea.AAC.2
MTQWVKGVGKPQSRGIHEWVWDWMKGGELTSVFASLGNGKKRTGGIGGGRVHGERKAWAQRRNEEMEWRRGILARMRKSSSLEHNTKGKVKGA